MSWRSDNKSVQRRKVLKTTASAFGVGVASTGVVAESDSIDGHDTDIDLGEVDTSDWIVTIESINSTASVDAVERSDIADTTSNFSGSAETYVSVGKNKADGQAPHRRTDRVGTTSVGGTQSIVTWDIPGVVPIVGGDEASVDVTAELGLSGVDAGISLCIDGSCIDIGGFSLDLFEADLIRIEVRGIIKGVPFEIEGALSVSASRSGFTPQLAIGGSLELCLGRDLCDSDDDEDGWESVSCQLCKGRSASGAWP